MGGVSCWRRHSADGDHTHALVAAQSHSFPDNIVALFGPIRAWNCSTEINGPPRAPRPLHHIISEPAVRAQHLDWPALHIKLRSLRLVPSHSSNALLRSGRTTPQEYPRKTGVAPGRDRECGDPRPLAAANTTRH